MYIPPSPMDMASLAGCKNWLGITNNDNDANLQACITAASIFFLRMTGRGPRNWQNTTQNPFNEPVDYSETYDGNLGQRLFLRNFPINSVSSLSLGGYSIPESNGPQSNGYAVDDQGNSLIIRGSGYGYSAGGGVSGYGGYVRGGGGRGRPFAAGVQQIQVQYNAGFQTMQVVDELRAVFQGWQASTDYNANTLISDGLYIQQAQATAESGTVFPPFSNMTGNVTPDEDQNWLNTGKQAAPYTIRIESDAIVMADEGVSYFSDGTPLERANVAPLAGQYYVISPGYYLFNAADQGKQVTVSYTLAGTPPDIILAIFQLVGLNYERRNWIGIRSIAMKDVGSTSYTLQLDPSITAVIAFYRRMSLNS